MARGGIRHIHGLTKNTLITYYSGTKKDPKYAFLYAFFLICLSCSFQNMSVRPKTHPFFQFCTFLHPLNDVCAYSAWSWKTPNYVNFWTSLIPPLTFECPPPGSLRIRSYFLYSYFPVNLIKGIVSDSNNIFLWHESDDINKKRIFRNFSWFQFYVYKLDMIMSISTALPMRCHYMK